MTESTVTSIVSGDRITPQPRRREQLVPGEHPAKMQAGIFFWVDGDVVAVANWFPVTVSVGKDGKANWVPVDNVQQDWKSRDLVNGFFGSGDTKLGKLAEAGCVYTQDGWQPLSTKPEVFNKLRGDLPILVVSSPDQRFVAIPKQTQQGNHDVQLTEEAGRFVTGHNLNAEALKALLPHAQNIISMRYQKLLDKPHKYQLVIQELRRLSGEHIARLSEQLVEAVVQLSQFTERQRSAGLGSPYSSKRLAGILHAVVVAHNMIDSGYTRDERQVHAPLTEAGRKLTGFA